MHYEACGLPVVRCTATHILAYYFHVGENRFEILKDLVQDGLITLYLQHHNVAQTMHEGQMQSMLRRKATEKRLKLLKRAHGKLVLSFV